jgi:transposase
MARRDLRQVSFADGLVHQRAGRNSWMDEIDKLIDWSAVVKLLDPIYGSDEGRPSYPLLTYVKLLLLQQWYGLSDPGLEEAVDDRLSFRRFAGLPLDESVPDHSTIWRFRQELAAHRLAEALFEEINRQLDARGLIVRQGTLIDATLLQASVKPPSAKEGTVSGRDPEAGWTQKNGKSHFGYKAHVAVDEGFGDHPHRDPHLRRPARQPAGGAVDPRRRARRLWRQGLRLARLARPTGRGRPHRRSDVQGGPQHASEAVAEVVQQGGRRDPGRARRRFGWSARLPSAGSRRWRADMKSAAVCCTAGADRCGEAN